MLLHNMLLIVHPVMSYLIMTIFQICTSHSQVYILSSNWQFLYITLSNVRLSSNLISCNDVILYTCAGSYEPWGNHPLCLLFGSGQNYHNCQEMVRPFVG